MWSKPCHLPGGVPFHGSHLVLDSTAKGHSQVTILPMSVAPSTLPLASASPIALSCAVLSTVLRRETPEAVHLSLN